MKKLLFILLIIDFAFLQTRGQSYQTMFTSDTCQWNVYEFIPDYGLNIVYQVFSDTIIESKKYFQLNRGIRYTADGPVTNIEAWGFIREDTVEGKYWYLDQDLEYEETLFMDLSLVKGEKFYLVRNYQYDIGDLIEVDSVYIENEKKVIECSKQGEYSNFKFIESIGPNVGFSISELNFLDEYVLLCKYDNDDLVYSTEANKNGDCYLPIFAGLEENASINDIEIYPNPASSLVNIHLNNLPVQNFQLYIYNSTGKCLQTQKISDSITNLKLTQKGLYLIVISDGNQLFTRKIINR